VGQLCRELTMGSKKRWSRPGGALSLAVVGAREGGQKSGSQSQADFGLQLSITDNSPSEKIRQPHSDLRTAFLTSRKPRLQFKDAYSFDNNGWA